MLHDCKTSVKTNAQGDDTTNGPCSMHLRHRSCVFKVRRATAVIPGHESAAAPSCPDISLHRPVFQAKGWRDVASYRRESLAQL